MEVIQIIAKLVKLHAEAESILAYSNRMAGAELVSAASMYIASAKFSALVRCKIHPYSTISFMSHVRIFWFDQRSTFSHVQLF
jgi:hypothetical protein